MSKIRILAFIIFIAVALISYFITRPVIQAQESLGDEAITGSVFYDGVDCEYAGTDRVLVYKWTPGGLVFIVDGPVIIIGGGYKWFVTPDDIDNQAGYYKLFPDFAHTSGYSPQSRDSVYWQSGTVKYNQHFTAVTCDHP